jgi:hypothetical protein
MHCESLKLEEGFEAAKIHDTQQPGKGIRTQH